MYEQELRDATAGAKCTLLGQSALLLTRKAVLGCVAGLPSALRGLPGYRHGMSAQGEDFVWNVQWKTLCGMSNGRLCVDCSMEDCVEFSMEDCVESSMEDCVECSMDDSEWNVLETAWNVQLKLT